MTSDQLKIEVQNDIMDARRKGITGVPFTVIDDKYAVCGGQPAELYSQVSCLFPTLRHHSWASRFISSRMLMSFFFADFPKSVEK